MVNLAKHICRFPTLWVWGLLFAIVFAACQEEKEHTAPAINDRDSVSMMVSYGVNTLISDSGIMKYRICTEEWEVNTVRHPSRWIFNKGIFMEQFDEQFHIEAFVQSDTAFYYDQDRVWELRGNVRVRTVDGLHFSSEELFWNQNSREFYSHRYSTLITPTRTMHGTYFRSDEQMTRYIVTNSKGSFESADFGMDSNNNNNNSNSNSQQTDTLQTPQRQQALPQRGTH